MYIRHQTFLMTYPILRMHTNKALIWGILIRNGRIYFTPFSPEEYPLPKSETNKLQLMAIWYNNPLSSDHVTSAQWCVNVR